MALQLGIAHGISMVGAGCIALIPTMSGTIIIMDSAGAMRHAGVGTTVAVAGTAVGKPDLSAQRADQF